MQLTQAFNPMQHDPTQTGGGGFPVGKHPVIIKSAELKPTQAGDGGLVEFQLEIIDGPARGTTGAYRLNLYNKSEKAARIAHSQLSALCHVTQQFQLGADGTQLSVLFNIPFVIEVGMQKGDEGYTEVKKVFDMAGNEPGKPPTNPQANANAAAFQQPAQQAAPQQQAPQGGAQAWGAPQGQPQGQQPAQGANGWGGAPQGQGQQAGPQQGQPGGWQQPGQGQPDPNAGQQGAPAGGWQQGQGAPQGGPSWGAPR